MKEKLEKYSADLPSYSKKYEDIYANREYKIHTMPFESKCNILFSATSQKLNEEEYQQALNNVQKFYDKDMMPGNLYMPQHLLDVLRFLLLQFNWILEHNDLDKKSDFDPLKHNKNPQVKKVFGPFTMDVIKDQMGDEQFLDLLRARKINCT